MMSFTISLIVGENSQTTSIVSIKNMCLFQPMNDQDMESRNEFGWTNEKSKTYGIEDTALKSSVQPDLSKIAFRQIRGGKAAESMQHMALPSKSRHLNKSPAPELSPTTNVNQPLIGFESSLESQNKKLLRQPRPSNFMVSTKKSTVHETSSLQTNKKIGWLVDSTAMLGNSKLSDISTMLSLGQSYADQEDQLKLRATLARMQNYFESLMRKIFTEHKSRFLNMDYIKAIFQEEINLKRDKDIKPSLVTDDMFKFSPVSATPLPKNLPINILRESFGSSRRLGEKPLTVALSPKLDLKSQLNRTSIIKKDNTLSDTNQASAADAASKNLLIKRGGQILNSTKKTHVREWKEQTVKLNVHDQFTVLVVDDNMDQIKVVSDLLTQFKNVETEHASDGLEAVQMVRSKLQQGLMYHMVITDIIMPYSGYETTKDIRKMEKQSRTVPRYRIYGITGDLEDPIVDMNATKSGMDGTIQKPLSQTVIKELFAARALELGLDFSFEYE